MRMHVGHSDDPSADGAAEDVLRDVRESLGAETPIAAVVYAARGFDHGAALARIRAALPGIPLVGCTTDGECSSRLAFAEDSLVLTVFASDRLRATVGVGRGLSGDLPAACREAWAQVAEDGEPSLVIALSESLGVSGVGVVEGLNEVVPRGVAVVGGTAGDQWRFESTRQFVGDEVLQDSVLLLALHGPLRVGVGVASGWEPLGRRARVTRSSGPVVHELDGQPALAWFRRYFGDREAPSPEHPFAVYDPPDAAGFYLRAPMRYSDDDGSIVFAADVPEGTEVRITEATRAAILDGAATAVRSAAEQFPGVPSAMLVFSCAARKQVLGTRTHEEIDRLRARGGGEVPLAGFYTYGEIAALQRGDRTRFHNETVVAVLLGE